MCLTWKEIWTFLKKYGIWIIIGLVLLYFAVYVIIAGILVRDIFVSNFGFGRSVVLFLYSAFSIAGPWAAWRVLVTFKKESEVLKLILVMISAFLVGLSFLQIEFGNNSFSVGKTMSGEYFGVFCDAKDGPLLANTSFPCNFHTSLNESNLTLIFRTYDRNEANQTWPLIGTSFYLTPPADVQYVGLRVDGLDETGTLVTLPSGGQFTFLRQEQYESKHEKFVLYLVGLLGIVLFSVPPMVTQFASLSKKK